MVVGDPHGLPRSKTFTRNAFPGVLRDGAHFSSSAFLLDTGGHIALDYLAEGAGVGVPELRGAGSYVAVPDPLTYRVLPWTSRRCAWVIADEYLRDGTPHPLSGRSLLRDLHRDVAARRWRHLVGVELEWYLTRAADPAAPSPEARAAGAGGFNLEGLTDALAGVVDPLVDALAALDLPLRTVEHETGPGQLEFTFDPLDGLEAADAVMLVRAATKQVSRRNGYHATFMALPRLPDPNPSGWHLHQSLASETGESLLGSDEPGLPLSELGRGFVGGLLHHAAGGTALATPTVNGYRRFEDRFGFAPGLVGWSTEHRGVLVRVAADAGERTAHVESRLGEPCANPYLYLASQLSAGLAGIDAGLDPGEELIGAHDPGIARLPDSLGSALAAFDDSEHHKALLGPSLTACWTQLKASELRRYEAFVSERGEAGRDVSEWEHREYFERF